MRYGGIGRWKPLVMRIIFSLLSIILVLALIASIGFAIFRTHEERGWLLPKRGGFDGLSYLLQDELRLSDSLVVQYFDYLTSTFTGDFYTSTGVRKFADVESLVYHSALGTIFLLAIVSTASVPLGMVWGNCMRKNAEKVYGRFLHVLAVSSLSFPMLYLALFLLVNANYLDLGFPIRGNGFDEGVVGTLQHAILPSLSLMVAGSGFFALVTRAGLLRAEQLGDGARPFRALDYVNPFPYFLLPLVMLGVLSVDFVFSYDGLGTLVWDAVVSQDVPVVMACFFVISAIVFFSQLAFRAVRERSRFMRPIDGILGPSEGTGSQNALGLRRRPLERLSISLLVIESKKIARAYMKHRAGVAAMIILAAFLVMGLFADVLSTVPNPFDVHNHEPTVIEDGMIVWVNPLPPSLTESPYTGFLHPLGTDHTGCDLYSMNLYAAGQGMAVVLWTCAISMLCGLFVGFLSIVSAHYKGLLSRLRRYSMAIVSQSFLAILAPFILVCLLLTPYRDFILSDANEILIRVPSIVFLLTFSVYCWVYRTITWPLSNSLRPVRTARRWNETREIIRDSMSLFRCYSPLVLSKTLHVTKYIVVLMFVFFSLSWLYVSLPFDLSWNYMLESARQFGAFYKGSWWMIVPPLAGIVALSVSSYFCIDTLERVFDERVCFHNSYEQSEEKVIGSYSGIAPEHGGAEPDVPTSTTGSSE
jgi:peptide/nickel transport system permease protein